MWHKMMRKKVTRRRLFFDRLRSPTQDLLMYVKGRSGLLGVTAPLVFWGSNRKIMVGFSWPSLMETQTNQRNSGKLLFSKKNMKLHTAASKTVTYYHQHNCYPSGIPSTSTHRRYASSSDWSQKKGFVEKVLTISLDMISKSEILCFTTMRCPFKNSWSSYNKIQATITTIIWLYSCHPKTAKQGAKARPRPKTHRVRRLLPPCTRAIASASVSNFLQKLRKNGVKSEHMWLLTYWGSELM